MGRLKVAIVLPYFGMGGGERMVALLASHLDLERFDVRVFCIFGQRQGNVMERMVNNHGVPIAYMGKGIGFSAKACHDLWHALDEFAPAIVHTHLNACMYCVPWCTWRKVPLLHTIHNIPEKEAVNPLRQKVMGFSYRHRIAAPVAISETNRSLTKAFYRLSVDDVEMVVNPVDLDSFAPSNGREALQFDFINVARLDVQKNQRLLLDACADVARFYPDVTLAIVGSGPLEDELKVHAASLGLAHNVSFLGRRDDVADLMRTSRVFIMSSDFEGLPISMLEAMACGLPVVSTRVGGVPDVLGENGLLVKPRDAGALSTAMRSVLAGEIPLEDMGVESRRLARAYDVREVAEAYGLLYERYAA